MRKTYSLNIEGKNPDRLLEAAKHDLRKYIKRERAKVLPAGVDFWDFDCKSGPSEAGAKVVPFAELISSVDAVVQGSAAQFYVEIVAKPGHRTPRPAGQPAGNEGLDDDGE